MYIRAFRLPLKNKYYIEMKRNIIFLLLILLFIGGCNADGESSGASNDGTGGSLAIFALKGNYLYTVDNQRLNVFSLINQEQPVKVNDVFVGFDIETLFSNDDYLYIGSRNGMFIYSIATPEAPVLLSSVQHLTACDPIVSNGNYSFVTLHSNTNCGNNINLLEVYDTSDALNPVLLHSRNLSYPKGLGLYNNYLFVCDDVIKIFDISTPENPTLVHSLNKVCYDVIIKNNNLFAIGENSMTRYLLDETDITNVSLKSELTY
jgi:hypothetical protein